MRDIHQIHIVRIKSGKFLDNVPQKNVICISSVHTEKYWNYLLNSDDIRLYQYLRTSFSTNWSVLILVLSHILVPAAEIMTISSPRAQDASIQSCGNSKKRLAFLCRIIINWVDADLLVGDA